MLNLKFSPFNFYITLFSPRPSLKHLLLPVLLSVVYFPSFAQSVITPARIHAHNDYHNRIPFFDAYRLGAGSIEADIILQDDKLYVAHYAKEIQMDRTLDSMYLRPLQKLTGMNEKNSGSKKRKP